MKFKLNDTVVISVTNTQATVVGRSEYVDHPSSYWLLYADAQGNAREAWWDESRIEAAPNSGEAVAS